MNEPAPMHVSPPPARGLAALMSFAVPGLGQIYQGIISHNRGRATKGVFLMVSLLGMFFYGMWLGQWRNVYLPHLQQGLIEDELRGAHHGERPIRWFGQLVPPIVANLYTRLHYVGQFWIGAAAWPALWNYAFPEWPIFGSFEASPGAVRKGEEKDRWEKMDQAEKELNEIQAAPETGKTWDIAWVYTVIAGVLNVLVIYDAWAGPVHTRRREALAAEGSGGK